MAMLVCGRAFYNKDEVAAILGIAASMAYQVIQKINRDIEASGGYFVSGKVNKRIFREKFRLDDADIVFLNSAALSNSSALSNLD